jgi:tetratricopeptide (TPR) repeat protein
VGPPSRGGESSKTLFLIARAHELSGDRSGAQASYINAAAVSGGWSEQSYFKGLALRKIGNESESLAQFDGLLKFAREKLQSSPAADFFEKFGERQSVRGEQGRLHLLAGLGLRGLKNGQDAVREFEQALALNPSIAEARRQIEEIGRER